MNFLKKLFSKRPPEVADVPPEFLQEDRPDWLIALKTRELSGQKPFSIRVQLFKSRRAGLAKILASHGQSSQSQTTTTDLDRTEIDRLFVILGFSFPDEIATVPSNADGGLPVTVTIHSQNPFMLQSADCNLAGWLDSKKSAPPVMEIARILLGVRNRSLPE